MPQLRTAGRPRQPIRITNPITVALIGAMDRSGMNDEQIAARAGIATNEISTWRQGHRSPTADRMFWVSEAIGAKVEVSP
jgi:transcriptional regulator with XRE-family HTH domain